MAVDVQLFKFLEDAIAWAASKSAIKRFWVYGSRLHGTQRSDSDIDISIEIDRLDTDSETQLAWMDEKGGWLSELQEICPYTVHLEMYGTLHVDEYLERCSMLVYERLETESDA